MSEMKWSRLRCASPCLGYDDEAGIRVTAIIVFKQLLNTSMYNGSAVSSVLDPEE